MKLSGFCKGKYHQNVVFQICLLCTDRSLIHPFLNRVLSYFFSHSRVSAKWPNKWKIFLLFIYSNNCPCEQKDKKVIVTGVILGSWRAKLKQWIHFRLINWKKKFQYSWMGVFFGSRLLHSAVVQITSNQPPFFHLPTKKQMEKSVNVLESELYSLLCASARAF